MDYLRVYEEAIAACAVRPGGARERPAARVFMMDLLATVPYYTAYLSKALLREPWT